jgi:hypothetical protein
VSCFERIWNSPIVVWCDASKSRRPSFDPVMMLKVLVLQKYHGLSDGETEFHIMDRFSFITFPGKHTRRKDFPVASKVED